MPPRLAAMTTIAWPTARALGSRTLELNHALLIPWNVALPYMKSVKMAYLVHLSVLRTSEYWAPAKQRT